MIVAVPTRDGRFCPHFGGAEAFSLFTVDEVSGSIVARSEGAPPEHARGVFPVFLRQQGVHVVLAGGMGQRASGIFAHNGIDVVLGVDGDDPEAMVRQYLAGTLASTGELCHDHGHHDCGQHAHEDGAHHHCGGHHDEG
jgi:predicted Fe-Mo cluster-binding NifX family protein